ncbi:TetR/AcrR family transcriptional regulator [Branchiibius cervicis]|uniref:TetR/AcrR family transcriptional regulator n=1 Tax=Branchiibius cervicis TaxID=908252 RepID=A0ABW2ATG6_9MICO
MSHTGGRAPTSKPSDARSRLLSTAARIFYREGIHAVGVDRLVSEAGVTRATFYRHFPRRTRLSARTSSWKTKHYGPFSPLAPHWRPPRTMP